MKKSDVIKLIKDNQDQRGIDHWAKQHNPDGLKSFGVGLTKLRKLAKQIGRDHALALELWESDIYEAKTIALLIDEPKLITKTQAEKQVEELNVGMLSHVFSSCDATLAKSPIAFDLANEWLTTNHEMRRRCGYGLLYELSKNKRNKLLTDDYFLNCIEQIDQNIRNMNETPTLRCSMGAALMGIGKRNITLNTAAIKVAKATGPIDFNEGDSQCEPLNILKHLTSDYLKKKFSISKP